MILKLTKPNDRHLPMGDEVGPVMCQAPEMICKEYNEKVDIWSIGIALYYMLSGEYPFADGDPAKLKFSILNGRYDFKRNPLLRLSTDRAHLGRAVSPLQGFHHGLAHH